MMKKILPVILMAYAVQIFAVTVNGHAYLEGETDHSGTEVFFQRVVPDTLASYTTFTDPTGYYSCTVENGYYDIEYSKAGFKTGILEDAVLYSDQTLSDRTLTIAGLEGSIKGILHAGVYNVTDTLTVLGGDSLIIEPGVVLNFTTDASFIINGYLKAEGTGADSIIFRPLNEEWVGIRFQQSSQNSSIKYSAIKNITETGIIVEESNLSLSNSRITSKENGILYQNAGYCDISNCLISALNSYYAIGEGILMIGDTELTLSRTTVKGFFYSVLSRGGHLFLENCVITSDAYGLVVDYHCPECVSVASVINCNIKAGIGIQAESSFSVAKVYNSILQGFNNGYGVGVIGAGVFGNLEVFNTNVYGVKTNFEYCGPYLGVIVTTNANGDPCDGYFNTYMDPKFVDAANGDFSLQSDSPCIDAGTNTISDYVFPSTDIIGNTRIWDGDDSGTSIVDIGAYEYGSSIPVSIEDTSEEIQNYQLYQNYPNPFNPVTTISYALPQASNVELNVYNLNGKLVQSLVNGRLGKGMHKAEFSGADLTSGMYIYNLKVDNKVVSSKKMMLLK
jgi:hypothetical protein